MTNYISGCDCYAGNGLALEECEDGTMAECDSKRLCEMSFCTCELTVKCPIVDEDENNDDINNDSADGDSDNNSNDKDDINNNSDENSDDDNSSESDNDPDDKSPEDNDLANKGPNNDELVNKGPSASDVTKKKPNLVKPVYWNLGISRNTLL